MNTEKNTALEKAFGDYLKTFFDMVRKDDIELYGKLKNMILNGKSDEVRDVIWEGIERASTEER